MGNGRRVAMEFDSRMRIDEMYTSHASSGSSLNLRYGYDATNNMDEIIDGSQVMSMTYDGLGRLSTATGPWGTGAVSYTSTGDITLYRLGSTSKSYTYSSGKLTKVTGGARPYDFSYDARGNVSDDGDFTYAWDDASRLLTVPEANASYKYDGNNRRVTVTEDGESRYQVHDHEGRLIGEYSVDSDDSSEYIYVGNRKIAETTREEL